METGRPAAGGQGRFFAARCYRLKKTGGVSTARRLYFKECGSRFRRSAGSRGIRRSGRADLPAAQSRVRGRSEEDIHRLLRRQFFGFAAVGAVQDDAGVRFVKMTAKDKAVQRFGAVQHADFHEEVQRAVHGRRCGVFRAVFSVRRGFRRP